jgi:hypothetical protein
MESFQSFLEMLDLASGASIMESYLAYDKLMQERTVVAGSFQWYVENSNSVQLDGRPIQGAASTRVRFGPCHMCTHPSLNVIEWQLTIDANQFAIQFMRTPAADANGNFVASTFANAAGSLGLATGVAGALDRDEVIEFWIGFPHAAAPFNQRILLPSSSGAAKSTLDYAAQETLLSMLSVPAQAMAGNEGFMGIDELFTGGAPGPGRIVRLRVGDIIGVADAADFRPINQSITINGIIDLNLIDPLYGSFPIMTPQWVNTHLQLNMDRVLRNLQVIHLNTFNGHLYLPTVGGLPPEKPQAIYVGVTGSGTNIVRRTAAIPASPASWSADPPTQANVNALVPHLVQTTNYELVNLGAVTTRRDLMYVRIINGTGNTAIPTWQATGQWNYLRTRQCLFQLEDQDKIMSELTKRRTLTSPIKHFTTYSFNGVSYATNMVSTGISTENIDKIYVQLPRRLEYPLFLPHPELTGVNATFKRVLYDTADAYIDVNARQRIMNCFVDTDKTSPSRNLTASLRCNSVGPGVYGDTSIWDLTAGSNSLLFGSNRPVFIPNQFVLAFDLGGSNEFRGANSKMPGAMSSYNPAETFRLTSADGTVAHTTGANVSTMAQWIANLSYGRTSDSSGNAIVTCLSFGAMHTTFNPNTGTVESITIE